MSDVEPAFRAARAALERGRLWWALPRAALLAVVGGCAFGAGGSIGQAIVVGAVVVVIGVFAGWRSRPGLQGAFVGSAIAAVPLVVGGVLAGSCGCAGGVCFSLCGVGCGGTAAVVAAGAGFYVARLAAHRLDFVGAALCAAGLGLLLCPASGVGSVVGAVVGAAVGFAPALALSLWTRPAHS